MKQSKKFQTHVKIQPENECIECECIECECIE